MLFLLRRIRQRYLDDREFRKYTLYALGEIALVVLGILIALQIDNWNTARKDQATIASYLSSIRTNITNDLASVNEVRGKREATYLNSGRLFWLRDKQRITRAETSFAYRALSDARRLYFFNPNTAAYESLKNSGVLDELQGSDIETLLFDYYDTVNRIVRAEQNHNDLIRALWMQILDDWPDDLADWEFGDTISLAEDRFEANQPKIFDLIHDTATDALHTQVQSVDALLLDYEKLITLGTVYIDLLDDDATELDEAARRSLAGIHNPNSELGYADVIRDGKISLHSYYPFGTDANTIQVSGRTITPEEADLATGGLDYRSIQQMDGSLRIDYQGGADWAGVWFGIGSLAESRQVRDFGRFDRLLLEAKLEHGDPTILINIEDADDPLDGSSTRYPLEISGQWQTFEIPLSSLETADPGQLMVPLGFVFLNEPQAFSLRHARYLEKPVD